VPVKSLRLSGAGRALRRRAAGSGHARLKSPWNVTGMFTSTSALATSLMSLALRMRRKAGFGPAPGLITMLSTTPARREKQPPSAVAPAASVPGPRPPSPPDPVPLEQTRPFVSQLSLGSCRPAVVGQWLLESFLFKLKKVFIGKSNSEKLLQGPMMNVTYWNLYQIGPLTLLKAELLYK